MPFLTSNVAPVKDAANPLPAFSSKSAAGIHGYPDCVIPLAAHQIHVWSLSGDPSEFTQYTSLLSQSELERAGRFRFPALYERFVADHARLRILLASYLDIEPQSLNFIENEQGKPRLNLPNCRLQFNMSHTRGLTMIAMCLDAEIGVDVEELRSVEDRDEIASMHFSPLECNALRLQPVEDRDASFLRCWTRKEAYIKAKGLGLSLPLNQFAVSLDEKKQAALVQCEWDNQEPLRWKIEHLQPASGFVGALAIEQGAWAMFHFSWGQIEFRGIQAESAHEHSGDIQPWAEGPDTVSSDRAAKRE